MTKTLLVTGSSGLIGSECASYFHQQGWTVHGLDNNMRRDFFGEDGDTTWNLARLQRELAGFQHHNLDIRDREGILALVAEIKPDYLIHCAAQPSHDLAAARPFDDFDVNAVGTLNLLEAVRQHAPGCPFGFMSTNKVYGDAPNELQLIEQETRYDYASAEDVDGISETMRIDHCLHSLFGAGKASADLMVQEYGRYFNMATVCFRGGCLTGGAHSAAEQHGFLAYLVRCVREGRQYYIYGYKGKQVRDNIHAYDVCRAFDAFYQSPRSGAVYNLGGGRANSVSILEAIALAEKHVGKKLKVDYIDENRKGDHICYISNLNRLKQDYPTWNISRSLDDIFADLAAVETGS
jgi:CDP-paratose 2-epimerase